MVFKRDRTLPTLVLATRVSRPWNMDRIAESVRDAIESSPGDCPVSWLTMCDPRAVSEMTVPNRLVGVPVTFGVRYLEEQVTENSVIPVMGNALFRWVRNGLLVSSFQERRPAPWMVFVDDDTVVHPELVRAVSGVMRESPDAPVVWVQQLRSDGRVLKADSFNIGDIDVGQGILNLGEVTESFSTDGYGYDSDGELWGRLNTKYGSRCVVIEKILSLHNALS